MIEVKHESGHYMKVKYDWMQVAADGTVSQIELTTDFLKEWTLV